MNPVGARSRLRQPADPNAQSRRQESKRICIGFLLHYSLLFLVTRQSLSARLPISCQTCSARSVPSYPMTSRIPEFRHCRSPPLEWPYSSAIPFFLFRTVHPLPVGSRDPLNGGVARNPLSPVIDQRIPERCAAHRETGKPGNSPAIRSQRRTVSARPHGGPKRCNRPCRGRRGVLLRQPSGNLLSAGCLQSSRRPPPRRVLQFMHGLNHQSGATGRRKHSCRRQDVAVGPGWRHEQLEHEQPSGGVQVVRQLSQAGAWRRFMALSPPGL